MLNRTVEVSLRDFQQKLDACKTKIMLQQLLAQSLLVEFESLSSDIESLKQTLGASLRETGATSSEVVIPSPGNGSSSEDFGVTSLSNGSSSQNFGVTSLSNGSSSQNFGVTSLSNGSLSSNHGVQAIQSASPLPSDGASIRKLSSLIRQSAKESLKIFYSKPDIPDRMAQIVLTLNEKKRLSVAEMRQITGVSRNSLGRDIKVLKLLGWLEFHGSRKNGYFTLTSSFPGVF